MQSRSSNDIATVGWGKEGRKEITKEERAGKSNTLIHAFNN